LKEDIPASLSIRSASDATATAVVALDDLSGTYDASEFSQVEDVASRQLQFSLTYSSTAPSGTITLIDAEDTSALPAQAASVGTR
jgi:Fe2+ transport system protein B